MITIGIYAENAENSNYLYETINKVMLPISNWQIHVYHHADEILSMIKEGNFFCQLLFMNVSEKEIMEHEIFQLTSSICKQSPDTDLIFVTDSIKNIYEYSQMHVFAYMLKPVSHEDIVNELTRYLKNIYYSVKLLEVTFQRKKHKIPVDSILYIESDLRKLIIHTPKMDYYSYGKLNEMEKELQEDGFIRCHNSYLVPLEKITYYSNSKLYINDHVIPISKSHQNSIVKLLTEHGIVNGKPKKRPVSYNQSHANFGIFVCVSGLYAGATIRIKPEQQIIIGRNGNTADIVVNLPDVSRIHCSILYHYDTMSYEICDMSKNGTFVNQKRLLQGEIYQIPKGSYLAFGNNDTVYRLG